MERKDLPKDGNLSKLPIEVRQQAADFIGEEVGKMFNATLKKANKFLNKFGFAVSVVMNFHELKKDDKNQ